MRKKLIVKNTLNGRNKIVVTITRTDFLISYSTGALISYCEMAKMELDEMTIEK